MGIDTSNAICIVPELKLLGLSKAIPAPSHVVLRNGMFFKSLF